MIKKLNPDNRLILKNFSFLTILRFTNIAVKFLLVTYLVRVLGNTNYGILAWTDSIIQYFVIFINFGFNVYAAKYIVENKGSLQKLNEVISAIYTIKLLFFLTSFLILQMLVFNDTFAKYSSYLFLMLIYGIGEVFFPIWYFQGQEKLKLATQVTVLARGLLLFLTLYFVDSENGIYKYIYILVGSNILIGFLGYLILVRRFKFNYIWVGWNNIVNYVKDAYMFFLSLLMSLTFNLLTIFLIGLEYSMEFVGGFDIALKVVLVFLIPFDMLQQAVYPTITRSKNKVDLKKFIFVSFVFGCFFSAIIYFYSEEILLIFGGEEMKEYSYILKILFPIPALTSCTIMLGTCTLVAFGYEREFNQSLIYTFIIYIVLVGVFYIIGSLSFIVLIWLRVLPDALALLFRIYFVKKRNIFNT